MNKTTTITLLGLGIALVSLTTPVQAQDVMYSVEKPFRVSVGVYSPSSSGMRNAVGSSLPLLSLSYDLSKTASEKPLMYSAYFDYGQNRKNGTNNSLTAFGVSARTLSRAPITSGRYFVGGGVGSYTVKVGDSNSKIGGKVFAGYEMNNGFFGEATYHVINKIHGTDPSGLSISVGKRF
jgi:hypothetical protein